MSATLMFREPRQVPRPTAAAMRRDVLNGLDRVESYPTLSDTAVRVMAMADRPDVSVAEVAGIIRRDGVLAVRILRAANSCAVRGRTEITDVQRAVLRLGMQESARLLFTMGLRGVYDRCPPAVRTRCDALLRHSLFVARLSAGLARIGTVCPPGPAFTAGLLHDIGRVVLSVKCDGTVADAPDVRECDETLGDERAAYGIDHCAIGYQFASHNAMPETVIRAALNHHRPEEERLQRPLVALIAVAERVANHVHRKHNIASYDPNACPRFAALKTGWDKVREDAFRAGLSRVVVQAIRDTRAMLKSIA